MKDQRFTFSGPQLAAVAAGAAVVASVFGFMAGVIGSTPLIRSRIAESLKLGAAPDAPGAPLVPDVQSQIGATDEERLVEAVEKASPAVVSIVASKDVPVMEQYNASPFPNNDFFEQFFGGSMPNMVVPQYRQNGTQRREIGAGSGFLVAADGYLVTNKHVVADEAAAYQVILQDGRKLDAKVLARDPANDIAVLKVDGADFPYLRLGDSDNLKVGQRVFAIGYALGRFSNTVSEGIVSGLGRSIEASDGMNAPESLYEVIQTDAAINPGNSGGPLFGIKGDVIGMNVAIVQGSQNIGFALPVNDVKRAVESVRKGGKISRAYLGVRYVMVTKELAGKNQLRASYGALVVRGDTPSDLAVAPGSPADVAGIEENDIILEADGRKLDENYPLAAAIAKHAAGDKMAFTVSHKGKEKIVTVTLGERK